MVARRVAAMVTAAVVFVFNISYAAENENSTFNDLKSVSNIDGIVGLSNADDENEIDNIISNESSFALDCEVNLIYNEKYHECVKKENETLTIPITVTNSAMQEKNVICYIAEYDTSGKLVKVEVGADENIAPGKHEISAAKTFSNSANAVKLFFWEKGSIRPLCNCVTLNSVSQDFFANSFDEAHSYDISKSFCGKIDTQGDVDIVKFVPNTSGRYIVNVDAFSGICAELYNSEKERVKTLSECEYASYIKADLQQGQVYYLKIYSQQTGEYEFSVYEENSDEKVTVTENSIKFVQNCSAGEADIKLTDSSGNVLNSVHTTEENGKICADFVLGSNVLSQYNIAVIKNNLLTSLFEVKIVCSEKTVSYAKNNFVSVPIDVKNINNLENVYFSMTFDGNEFELYDACEYTYNERECETKVVSSAQIDIKDTGNDFVVFKSLKSVLQNELNHVNTVKLQALKNGESTIKLYAYKVI